jgi:tRNA-splicing endonuclease subunit Sen2
MSMIGPSTSRGGGSFKAGGKRSENNHIYANALPLIFSNAPSSNSFESVLNALGLSLTKTINPHCEGVFDPTTRSVWVLDKKDVTLLWQRGFFGKGDLSRSEPSWFSRQMNIRQSGGVSESDSQFEVNMTLMFLTIIGSTSEEIREKRRLERKQFKLDRAAAIAAVAEEAEKIFATEGRVIVPALSGPNIPSAATWKPKAREEEVPADIKELAPLDTEQPSETQEVEPLADVEHLQLTLQEAFFLAWGLDCLTIFHPKKVTLTSVFIVSVSSAFV